MALRFNRCEYLLFTCRCVRAAAQMRFWFALGCWFFSSIFLCMLNFCSPHSLSRCSVWNRLECFSSLGQHFDSLLLGWDWDLSVYWSPSHCNFCIYRLKMWSGVGSVDQVLFFCWMAAIMVYEVKADGLFRKYFVADELKCYFISLVHLVKNHVTCLPVMLFVQCFLLSLQEIIFSVFHRMNGADLHVSPVIVTEHILPFLHV